MPPKSDPYATSSARIFDFLLCILAILLIVIAILTAPRQVRARAEQQNSAPTRELAVK